MFKSLIYFELIFVKCVRIHFHFLIVVFFLIWCFPNTIFSKRPSFTHWMILAFLLKIICPYIYESLLLDFHSILLSVFTPASHCFDCGSIVLKSGPVRSPTLSSLSRLFLLFGSPWNSIWILRSIFYFCQKCHWNVDRDCTASVYYLG